MFLLIFCALVAVAKGQQVNSVHPNNVGTYGETRLRIFGKDFPVDLNVDKTASRKEVILVNSLNQYTCDVHEEESDEAQTVCYTRPMAVGTYYLRMRINGIDLHQSKYCGGHSTSRSCSVQVQSSLTPTVASLSWVTNKPQQIITLNGRIITTLTTSTEETASNGATSGISRIYVTSGCCELYKSTDVLYGVTLSSSGSQQGSMMCRIKSQFVGNQNLSFIVSGTHGSSYPYKAIRHVSADNRIYMFQTYAVVEDVHPKEGSIHGGTLLTITGKYFDEKSGIPVKVLVGGEECDVKTVNDTQIECRTPAQPGERLLYPGGRGILHEVFDTQDIDANLDELSAVRWYFSDCSRAVSSEAGNLVTRSRGFFIPSITANHKFKVKANNNARVFVSKTGKNPNNKEQVVASSSASNYASSEDIPLVAGTEYYFEIRHRDASSSMSMQMAIYSSRTNYTPHETGFAKTDVQRINLATKVVREKQVVTLHKWETQNPKPSVWKINVTCKLVSCAGYMFQITLFRVTTDPIPYAATAEKVESALELVVPDVEVAGDVREGYEVTFTGNLGRMDLLVNSSDDDVMAVTAEETAIGIPDLKSVTFMVDGYVTEPVSTDATADIVESAVLSLFGPLCSQKIEKLLAKKPVIFRNDLEHGGIVSGSRTTEKSLCGLHSVKNPTCLFRTENDPIDAAKYSKLQLCFAYVGDVSNQLRVSYSYFNWDIFGYTDIIKLRTLRGVDLVDSSEWTHVCIDLKDLLTTMQPTGTMFKIYDLCLVEGSNPHVDLFLDNIFIASGTTLSSDRITAYFRAIRPPVIPDIRLSSLSVTKTAATNETDQSYTIVFVPFNCGHNFPLLGFAFGNGTVDADKATYGDNWNSTSRIHVIRAAKASPPVGGTFDLSFEDGSHGIISNLATNVPAGNLATQLESLSGISTVSASYSGNCHSRVPEKRNVPILG